MLPVDHGVQAELAVGAGGELGLPAVVVGEVVLLHPQHQGQGGEDNIGTGGRDLGGAQ